MIGGYFRDRQLAQFCQSEVKVQSHRPNIFLNALSYILETEWMGEKVLGVVGRDLVGERDLTYFTFRNFIQHLRRRQYDVRKSHRIKTRSQRDTMYLPDDSEDHVLGGARDRRSLEVEARRTIVSTASLGPFQTFSRLLFCSSRLNLHNFVRSTASVCAQVCTPG